MATITISAAYHQKGLPARTWELGDDGTWLEVAPRPDANSNHYLHLSSPAPEAPTEAQRATIARWYFGAGDGPGGDGRRWSGHGPGAPLIAWAFADIPQPEIERRYGPRRPYYYTVAIRDPLGDAAEIARIGIEEAALESACEAGLISGAAPAD